MPNDAVPDNRPIKQREDPLPTRSEQVDTIWHLRLLKVIVQVDQHAVIERICR